RAAHPRGKYDPAPVRQALKAAFKSLPAGEFFAASDVAAHFAAPERNPFLLGRPLAEVALWHRERLVLPLEEVVEAATREALEDIILERLLPLGCLRLGVAADNRLLVSRLPRLGRYFDGSAPPAEAPSAGAECRVVVQPDFSAIVIGLNPGPAAELAAFAGRDRAARTPGAVIFRLTREDAFRGLMGGLTGEAMVAVLRRLSSMPVPANVEAQVLAWAAQGRVVTTAPMLVVRCPDEATADRAMSALGKKAERLGPRTVGLPDGKLPAALRQKLAAQGVMVGN
ncbi:MAG: helicase-associated domain-containing protein, partial [Gemmataceae bacterium]|nr:helicase-associated domain-containing protein [Gemmataceae bacterium]